MLRITGILLLFCAVCAHGIEIVKLSETEKQFLPLRGKEVFSLGRTRWKIFEGENKAAVTPDFDDSQWYSGLADCALSVQGFKKVKLHTIRKTFDLPAGLEKENLFIDLGFISFYDKVYLNGRYLGSFGTYPKAVVGSSWVRRKYLIPAREKLLKAGKNTLTLFVYPGSGSGMYCGVPALKKADSLIFPGFKLKTAGREALAFNLSDAEHLNNFRRGVPLNLEMTLSSFYNRKITGKLCAEILTEDKKLLQKSETSGTLFFNSKTAFPALKLTAPASYGTYRLRMSFREENKILWEKTCAFNVKKRVKFTLPVDRSLKNAPLQYNVSKDSTGHFGPRHHKNGKLVYDLTQADTRGTLAFSINPKASAPQILMPNVMPSPKNQPRPRDFLVAKGYTHDGFPDAWILGNIRPGSGGKAKHFAVESANWGEIKWRYTFEKAEMSVTASTIHPALRMESASPKLRIFDRANFFGTGLPTRAAAVVNGKIFTGKANGSFPVSKLSENWLLVWFSGNSAYSQFDIPWLLVFKHRIKSLKTPGALEFDFGSRGAGEVLLMPLYGVTLQRPAETEKWNKKLPDSVVEKCRLWSRILAAAPRAPQRTFKADFAKDQLVINDYYTHRLLNDDWKTPVEKVAPVYPILPLILSGGAIKGAIHASALDLDYATLHGPLFAVPGNGVTISFWNLLRYVSEVRVVQKPQPTVQTKEMIARLDKYMLEFLQGPLKDHPGYWLFSGKKFLPGHSESLGNFGLSDVLDAFRYCSPDIRKKQQEEFRKEMEEYFLNEGLPAPGALKKIQPKLRKKTVVVTLLSPTGKKLSTYRPNEDDFGIDSCCWESLKLYAVWNYARTCQRFAFVRKNWDHLKRSYNMIPNSHDWAVGISYDAFSGIRVGNGLQETGIMHAGMAAMARMAHALKDTELRDRASYYSVMQLCGLLGAMSANTYLRDHRPTVAGNRREKETVFSEYYRKMHYVEFNENGGFTQYVMSAATNLNSQHSYIMTPLPEVMRPYKEIFSKQTDDFYAAEYDNIPFNRSQIPFAPKVRLYMVNNYPLSVMDLYQRRKDFSKSLIANISDICAALDSLGKVSYKKLWNK